MKYILEKKKIVVNQPLMAILMKEKSRVGKKVLIFLENFLVIQNMVL